MTRFHNLVTVAVTVLGLAAVGFVAHAQSRETLETEVSAEGDVVLLKWSRKHPWDAQLSSGPPALVAEYRGANTQVGVDCLNSVSPGPAVGRGGGRFVAPAVCSGIRGIPKGDAKDRTLLYRLPAELTASPAGPVCLYFQLPGNRLLPLRLASEKAETTTRFRHEEWERAAGKQTIARDAKRSLNLLREPVGIRKANVERLQAVNVQRGWTSDAACEAIQAPKLAEVGAAEHPVAEPARRDELARQVCVAQVWNADQDSNKNKLSELARLTTRDLLPPAALAPMLDSLASGAPPSQSIRQRREEFASYSRDWQRFSPTVAKYYADLRARSYRRPHFGQFDSTVALQSLTAEVGKRIASATSKGDEVEGADLLGFVGGSLDAYARCLSDGKAEMETAFTADTQLREREPQLQIRARDQLVMACRQGLRSLADEQAKLTEAEREVAKAEELVSRTSNGAPAALSRRKTVLNDLSCSP